MAWFGSFGQVLAVIALILVVVLIVIGQLSLETVGYLLVLLALAVLLTPARMRND